MLKDMIGENWVCDGQYSLLDDAKVPENIPNPFIYEVIRVKNGRAVFLDAHLERLSKSVDLIFNMYDEDEALASIINDIKDGVSVLIQSENIQNNNLKIALWYSKENKIDDNVSNSVNADSKEKAAEQIASAVKKTLREKITWRVYQIKSNYPSKDMYDKGVKICTIDFERPDPLAKVYYKDMKDRVKHICETTDNFEVLLKNVSGAWTEGSRSNLFFIADGKVYSAPRAEILHGITRMKLLDVLKQMSVELVETSLDSEHPEKFEAAFLTGTSIHVLPIYSIDSHVYDSAKDELCKRIVDKFEDAIADEYGK